MRNKILIVHADSEEKIQLEQILQKVVEQGGELFFADRRSEGLKILKKERPQVLFLDAPFVGESGEDWLQEGVHIILMRHKNEPHQQSEDFVLKPLKAHQVLEKCHLVLNKEPVSQMPPM